MSDSIQQIKLHLDIPADMAGLRLDQALADLAPDYSRGRWQQWIKQGDVLVDGAVWRPRDKVMGGESIAVATEILAETDWQAEDIPLDILFEDASILVLNKPAGLVVHPAVGNRAGTLLNALLHHAPQLAGVPRAGIVHRLDKDTSGLLVIAKTITAQKYLVEQLQERAFEREYLTVVSGVMTAGGTVEARIGRHPVNRKRMAVVPQGGKEAITHYRVQQRYRSHTLVRVKLETGRTHQIRVHMAHIHYPVLGDPVYAGRLRLPRDCDEDFIATLRGFRRQALHAARLGLSHPESGEWLEWQQPLPDDMQQLIAALERDLACHQDKV
ncbi:MAG: 23S rRNA pseudouridine(1911/1915/1917) synthase RluD [Gammaproteobacteria bacterium]